MSIFAVVGLIVLIHIGIIALCFAVLWLEKHYPSKEFDERQKLNRYKASRLSQLIGWFYFLVVAVILIWQVDGEKTIEPFLLVMFGILLQVTIDHTYCLLTHSALPFSQKRTAAIAGYLFCGVTQILSFAISHDLNPLSLTGRGSSGWVNLIVGIDFLYLALMHIFQLLWREKE